MDLTDPIAARAAEIRCIVFDVDGVLTDGKLYLGPDGAEWKAVSVRDGLGIRLLVDAGIEVVILSGRPSPAIDARFRALGVREIHLGLHDKTAIFDRIIAALGFTAADCAVMGDDLPDLPLMRRAGLSFAVADAHPTVRDAADWVSVHRGGEGAAREACDLLLASRGAAAQPMPVRGGAH